MSDDKVSEAYTKYKEHEKEVRILLADIRAKLEKTSSGYKHWGDVAEIAHLHEMLSETKDWYLCEGEYSPDKVVNVP